MTTIPLSDFKTAQWIWFDRLHADVYNSYMEAYLDIDIPAQPDRADILITADSRYRLWVNGQSVCRGPARGYQDCWPVDSVNIAPYLQAGKNRLSVIVHSYGCGLYYYVHGSRAGLLISGNASGIDISTGKQWLVRRATGYQRQTARLSLQQGFQEHFDSRTRLETDSADAAPVFDPNATGWRKPHCEPVGVMPWHSFETRDVPLLKETVLIPESLVSVATAPSTPAAAMNENVLAPFVNEKWKWKTAGAFAVSKTSNDFRVSVPASEKKSTKKKTTARALTFDFGKEVVGSVILDIDGAGLDGAVADILVTEGLQPDGLTPVFLKPEEHCRVSMGGRLVLRDGRTRHEFFHYFGFRYLVVILRNADSAADVGVRLREVVYDLDIRASFQSTDETLNGIWDISRRTQLGCLQDAYVDCPWREQAQWWGDARVQGANTFYLSADARPLARGIRQIDHQRVPNGLTYGHVPTMAHNCILPDFTLTWVMTHWDYYWQTGDLSLFDSLRARVRLALDYFPEFVGSRGLLTYDKRYWLFLDWADIPKAGASTLYNLFYLMALRTARDLSRLAGDADNQAVYSSRAVALEAAIRANLWDSSRSRLLGGLDETGEPIISETVHAASLAILLDLFPDRRNQFFDNYFRDLLSGMPKHGVHPSPFFMHYTFEALKAMGKRREVVGAIRKWWGDMLSRGLTTTEEMWYANVGSTSLCHAWSAHPIVHLSNIVLGVEQAAPGWTKIRFRPELGLVESVSGSVAVPQGVIRVDWSVASDRTAIVKIALPDGIKADIELPSVSEYDVTGGGEWKTKMLGN